MVIKHITAYRGESQAQVNLKEPARNKLKLGQAFMTNKTSLCHDLEAGWWLKGKACYKEPLPLPPE